MERTGRAENSGVKTSGAVARVQERGVTRERGAHVWNGGGLHARVGTRPDPAAATLNTGLGQDPAGLGDGEVLSVEARPCSLGRAEVREPTGHLRSAARRTVGNTRLELQRGESWRYQSVLTANGCGKRLLKGEDRKKKNNKN